MRKILVIIIGFLIAATSFSALTTTTAHANINDYVWLTPVYRGHDEFYDAYVVAYEANSTAQLLVKIYNQYGSEINVTAVKVWFDWNMNYSSTETPCVMQSYESRNFIISFTVPDTSIATNLITHSCVIYVEYERGGFSYDWSYDPWEYFAVYSTDQAGVVDLSTKYEAYSSSFPYYYFYSAEARSLVGQAQIEAELGYLNFMRGEFAEAKAQYETALDLYSQAITAEKKWTMDAQELELNVTRMEAEAELAQANAAKTQADAAMVEANAAMIEANATKTQADAALILANAAINQSYAWILFGIGFVIISLGVLVYAVKKPRAPTQPTTQQ